MVIHGVLQYGLPGLTDSDTGWVHQTGKSPSILRISAPVPSVLIRHKICKISETVTNTSQSSGKAFQNLPVCFLSLSSPCITSKKRNRKAHLKESNKQCRKCLVLWCLLLMSKPDNFLEAPGNRNSHLVLPNIPQMSSMSGRLVITANERWIHKAVHKRQARILQMQTYK